MVVLLHSICGGNSCYIVWLKLIWLVFDDLHCLALVLGLVVVGIGGYGILNIYRVCGFVSLVDLFWRNMCTCYLFNFVSA